MLCLVVKNNYCENPKHSGKRKNRYLPKIILILQEFIGIDPTPRVNI